nr:basic leucine zipper 61-like [Tanacetum cinerariifolium]
MAHLPPKVPQNWPENYHNHQKQPSTDHVSPPTSTTATATAATQMDPSWVDDFLDFSSTKRGSHRRSMSDSAAFLEIPMMGDDSIRRSSAPGSRNGNSGGNTAEFDRFDEEQFMSMFIDDETATGPTVSCSNPSSPSDHNSMNEHQQIEEEESSWKSEAQFNPHASVMDNSNDKIFDPKRIKRSSAPGSRNGNSGGNTAEFDRFDEEQFMSMFIDDETATGPTVSCSNPSSPSDHNSMNEHQQIEEEESSWKSEAQFNPHASVMDNSNDKIFDPKRIKRILANRQSAQRSRVRKLQYISELERSVNSLQAEVSVLSPRVAYLDHQRLVLNVDNSVLKQRIAALSQDKIFKDAHQEALKAEIERLKQMYYQQNLNKKMEKGSNATHHHDSPISDHANTQEQLMIN